jgi:2,4-dienoyl-CoA reductase-like NADH-dependent reductase (Old Yellow Enzyme family)/thioredoxin reductase
MLQLQSNFIFPPIKLGYTEGDGKVTLKHLDFYGKRNKHIGAITPEPLYMDPGLRELPTQLGIDNDNKIPGLKLLNETIHRNGAKSIAHLNHPGRMVNPKIPGNFFWSSTDKACENGGAAPEKMNREMMGSVIELFIDSAKRAVASGFDMIELQFGHGYLMAQFISPAVNDRDDEYGGSYENKVKFPLEVAKAVREAVDIPIIARISGDEMIPDGFHIEEMVKFSRLLKTNGINAIHVSAGSACSTPPWFFQHMFVPKGKTWELARQIKDEVNIPIIFVGQINRREDIENLTKNYNVDYIAIGRALIADPDFIGKCINNVEGNIRPCLACAEGCLGGVRSGQGLQCLVNPEIGKETNVFTMADKSKHYAVVGGGLAGMEAVLTLKKRGHLVDLYEKNELGGQFNLAPLTPNKKSMAALVPYFIKELKDNNINVIYKEAVKSDLINKYDGVIIASGSKPASIKIPGLDKPYWAEILCKENLPKNRKVLIIGGGLIGVDIATALIPLNNQVIIVKRTTDFGEDMEMIAKTLSLKMMKEKGTVFSDHTYIKKVEGRTIYADKNGGNIQFNDVDLIVVSTGMRSFNPLKDELGNDIPVYIVGDAQKTGNAQDAIHGAYEQAIKL